MSIDNRVVHLGFDNAQFEAGVAKSMNTLDKLKAALDFKGSSDGLTALQRAANTVDFTALIRGVESLEYRFSLLGIAGMNVANKITDSVIGAAKKLEQATIGQIKTGGWSRAMNLANAQFTIEGLKLDWNEMLKSINYGVQDTAYGLDSAAKAASSLAASGVGYKESIDGANDSLMHTSLRAISGVAAMTNSSYDDIAHVFTTVAGQGRLMSEQLNSLAARGMNAAATLGEQLGKSEAEIREMVSKGQIDFEMFAKAMDSAFGEHAKEANKTFTGALSNMKAALSRIGAIFATPIIEKTNEVFIALTGRIKEVQKALNDFTDNEGHKTLRFAGHFAEAWANGVTLVSELINKFDMSWFTKIAEKMDETAIKVNDFFKDFKFLISGYHDDAQKMSDETGKTLSVTVQEAETAKKVIAGLYGNGGTRKQKLTELFGADSAKRIQDYVDSVAAAGWDYEKASIKVSESNEKVSSSVADQVKAAKEQRKIKFHAIMNQISAAFGNFTRAGKNLVTAASKIGSAIFSAFKKVFGIKDAAYDTVQGITGLIVKFANFTEKLIISDYTAAKVTKKFVSFFTVIKTGIGYIKTAISFIAGLIAKFVKARVAIAQLPQAAQDALINSGVGVRIFGIFQTLPEFVVKIINKVRDILTHIKDIKLPFLGTTGTFMEKLKTFGETVWETIKTSFQKVDWSDKISGIFNFLVDIISNLEWGKVAKIGGIAYVVYTLTKTFLLFKSLGNVVETVMGIPSAIKKVFTNLASVFSTAGKSMKKMANAYSFFTIAKSIALIGGIVIALANVDTDKLIVAIGVIFVISKILTAMAKLIDNMTRAEDESKGILRSFKNIAESVKTIYAMAILIAAVGAAVLLIGGALSLLKVSAVDGGTMLLFLGILTALGMMVYAIVLIIGKFPDDMSTAKIVGSLLSISLLIAVVAASVIAVSVALKVISTISPDSIMGAIDIIAAVMASILLAIYLSSKLAENKPTALLATALVIAAIGAALSAIVLSVAAALSIIIAALSIGKADMSDILVPLAAFAGIIVAVLLFVAGMSAIAMRVAKESDAGKFAIAILSLSVMLSSLSGALLLMALSLKLLNGVNIDFNILTMIVLIVVGMVALVEKVKDVPATTMLAAAVAFMSIGIALNLLMFAISRLSRISFAASGLLIAAGVIALVIVAFAKIAELRKAAGNISAAASEMRGINASIGYVIAGIVGFALSMLILAAAFKVMDDVKNVWSSLLVMVALIVTIGIAVAALTAIASKSFNSGDALVSIGTAFVLIAASMLIFAFAVEKMSGVSGNLVTIGIAFAVFLAVLVGLGALIAKFPKLGEGIMTVGKAFLYIGAGAALFGVGMYIVVEAIKNVLQVAPLIVIALETFFTMLEQHYPIIIIITVIIIALTVAITALGLTIGPIIETVCTIVKNGAEVILNVLKAITASAKSFVSNLSTKGKATLVTLITTLCAALLDASPEMLKTIKEITKKVLKFIVDLIPTLVEGLFKILINLLNSLAEKLRENSAELAYSLWNVVEAVLEVLIDVLTEGVMIFLKQMSKLNIFGLGEKFDKLANSLSKASLETKSAMRSGLESARQYVDVSNELADAGNDVEKAFEAAKVEMTDYNKATKGGGGHWDETAKSADNAAKSVGNTTAELAKYKGELASTAKAEDEASKKNGLIEKIKGLGLNLGNVDLSSLDTSQLSGILNGNSIPGMNFNIDSASVSGDMPDMQTFMEQNGYNEEDISFEAYDNGETYTDSWASGMASNDSQTQIQNATADNVGVVQNELEAHGPELSKSAEKGVIVPITNKMNLANKEFKNEGEKWFKSTAEGYSEGYEKYKKDPLKYMAQFGDAMDKSFRSKDGIDSNSPSKKFYQSGLYCIMGIQQAIKDNSYLATGQVETLGDTMVDSIGESMDYVAKIASGEIEYDPRVRPVLDTSSIGRGAGDITSMFAHQNVSLAGLSGQIAYDMTNLNGSNAAVVSELQALREDMNYMTEEMANMQIVMDTGALVGSTVSAYDDALGRRAIYGERGN